MKKVIKTSNAPAPIGPYNQAILVGETLYVSGQIAINPQTNEFVREGIEAETTMVLKNIEAILAEAGMTFSNVIKCSIFVKNMGDFPVVNEIYGKKFIENAPARETVGVAALPKDALVEISCIAIK